MKSARAQSTSCWVCTCPAAGGEPSPVIAIWTASATKGGCILKAVSFTSEHVTWEKLYARGWRCIRAIIYPASPAKAVSHG